ncbi:uncharacterized protein LOC122246527 [Penaeus japonicus]|uniref:uncharacterized protein LOC122246527 n=1 Tax=Penaeus japonicus TaxID=27405 RepID=UPI001C70CB87|nr:uncharacterized protein LOC122246527 [Penaeus japonicus]
MPGQVSQCIAGNWTQVLDVCTEDCLVPRDCSEILQLGMNETGVYRIIPSGDSHGTSVEAWCDMDADGYDPSGGGWTTVLRRNPSESSFAGETLDWHRAAQLFPDRSAADNDFFIGLDNLVQLNRYPNGTVRPLVFQFLLEVSGEPLFHASYDSVVVGEAPGFTLLEVGRFHGNAGDCFSQHVGYNFTGDDEFWWLPEDGANYMSFLTKDAGEWKTLKDHGKTPEGLTLRVRPRDFDQAVSCPAMDVMDEDWMGAGEFTWEGEVTLGRLPGHVIEYTCQGEMMAAGAGGSAGVVGCEVDAGGGLTPSWNSTFEPPCVFTCPDDFVNSRNTTCYHFSTSAAEKGIVEAARRCGTLGATLAAVSDEADLAGATAPAFYFTGHTLSSLDVATPDLSFLECADSCSASPSSDCVVVNASARAAHDCEASDAHFVCQVPAYCPAGYTVFRGMCYKLLTASDHKEALVACNAESAALAYPEEPDVLFFLSALFRESISVTSPKWVMVGLNDAWGNWSGGGLYSPSAELISQALTSDSEHWRVITIPVAEDQLPHFTPFTIRTGATKAFCQFPGPVGCWIEPLEPTANMTRSWDNSSAISTEITYTCNYGYFVDGNTSLTEQTVECLGQLGGWYPPTIADCYRVEVCLEVPSPPSSAIANVSDSESLFLGGSVNFTCPPTMATAAAASLQVLTCTESSGAFGFQPQQVEPCTVCAAEPEVLNASTTWVNTSTWQLDSTITATCDADHLVAIGETSFTITCNETGWQHEAACYEGCVDEPPAPGDNMTRDAVEWAGVGVVLHYNCSPGYYIPPTEAGEAPLTRTKVTCLANHTWTPEGPDLNCSRVCLGSPPSVDPPANSSWDGVTSVVGTQFELSCPPDYFFGDLNSSVAVECGDDEQWTAVDPELLHCRRVCNSSLPPEPANAALVAEEPPYWEGASATYVCPQGMLSKAGQTSASVECASEGWTQLDPDFACFNSCLSLPPEGPARVSSNYTGGRVEGTAVEYTCLAGFYDPGSATPPTSVTSVCEGGSWSLETLPYCGGK